MFLNRIKESGSILRSTAIRQTLILLGAFSLITTLAWLATYWMVVRDTNRLVELRLETLVDSALDSLESDGGLPQTRAGHYLAIVPENGVTRGTLPPAFSPAKKRSGFHHLESRERFGEADFVVLIRDTPRWRIVAGENTESLEEATDILLAGLQFALVTSLLAAFVAGLWIARRNQTRLDSISTGLALVSQGQLSNRIKLAGPDDDLSLLANRIDATTARLESAMTQMRVQAANIAHDLRTPLARLRAVIEERHIALIERDEPVREEVLVNALEQIDQIVGTFNALLRIARIESGEQKSSFTSVDLGELLDSVSETFGPVVEDRNQTLAVKKNCPAIVSGDPDMMVQLLGNLIQNAMRHGAQGQEILLVVDDAQVSVSDQGPGIPLAERERVLQPLYQLESQRQGEGHGLGLSLVSAICDLHDAQLELTDGPDGCGLTVVVRFR